MRVVLAAVAVGLVLAGSPAYAGEDRPTVAVADQAGAPREMLEQLAKVAGRPLGEVQRVLAVDAGKVELTAEQAERLVAGGEVDGVKVLGTMPGGKDLLGTTFTDLSDGAFDGPGEVAPFRSALIFGGYLPDGREWCLTMCISTGRSVAECVLLSRS
ncbi:hypothetical protein ACFQZ4_06955 [Catellatospora coxensis]|uniref:Uncharacterized protein n=1 Tax=Catellatospora coxensis TaxID=310354 RepID=A0A8J3LCY0_9ACTN|nr:hypothetical protein [Catellatospora coxensis]GIG10410.1 hypothetical protein Cco03nite_71100 [Catellatospora coxensis]